MNTLDQVFDAVEKVSVKDKEKLIIFGATQEGDRVVGKVEYTPDGNSSGIAYEAAVYTQVIAPMVADRESANLVTAVAWIPDVPLQAWAAQVNGIDDIDDEAITEIIEFTEVMGADFGEDASMSTLVTREPPNLQGTLFDVFNHVGSDWRVLFQMAYTLAACEEAGLSHNDNHLANWLVSDAMPVVYYAVTETDVVAVDELRVWLFDWDLGYATQLGPNPLLERNESLCTEGGVCNSVNGLHDLALMACALDITNDTTGCGTDDNPVYMWKEIKSAMCANAESAENKDTPCHMPADILSYPVGVNSALDYVLQMDAVSAHIKPVSSLDDATINALISGETRWVAHRGINREAFVNNLLRSSVATEDESELEPPTSVPVKGTPRVNDIESVESVDIVMNLPWKRRRV